MSCVLGGEAEKERASEIAKSLNWGKDTGGS